MVAGHAGGVCDCRIRIYGDRVGAVVDVCSFAGGGLDGVGEQVTGAAKRLLAEIEKLQSGTEFFDERSGTVNASTR